MDGSPNFFSHQIHEDDDDGYGLFDNQDVNNEATDRQDAPYSINPDGSSAPISPDQAHLLVTSPTDSIYVQSSMKCANSRTKHQLKTPPFDAIKVESPGFSSGSSETTQQSHSSQQTIAPTHAGGESYDALSNDDLSPSGPPPAKRRKQRKKQTRKDVDHNGDEVKRDRFLERNRVAATKCRQKKKEWVSDLEETRFGLESQHNHLQMEYSSLRNEITQIKSQLMEHAGCHDPNINKWIENEAKRFVLGAGERYDHMLANLGSTPEFIARRESMSSTSGYPTAPESELTSPVSESYRGSISFPPAAMAPNSPLFYRSDLVPGIADATTSLPIADTYSSEHMSHSMAEDSAGFGGIPMSSDGFHDSGISEN
ncbi:hypothetical protein F4819DRAFT_159162 [Hypoxylon fuscum]|nr:hypothetical protein F4819DRAFT_159162 [Hypoxylon fuscum]